MPDTYWDDMGEPDGEPDDQPPMSTDEDGDSFEVRTVDTGQLRRMRQRQAAKPKFPEIPVAQDDVDSVWEEDPNTAHAMDESLESDDDTFTAFTVEPQVISPSASRIVLPVDQANRRAALPARPSPKLRPDSPRRRQHEKTRKPPSALWITLRMFIIVLAAAVLVSTIFSLWTQPSFFTDEFRAGLNQVQATQRVISIQPSPLPTEAHQIRIGIVAGHTGPPLQEGLPEDPGAVCDDGLTERSINEVVAREVVAALRRDQYTVDLLEEFDPRLNGYQADVLVSIHTNDCQDYGAAGTGYSIASALARQTTRGQDERLLNCLIIQYGATTGLPQHQGLTFDMTDYHTFGEVAVDTPTAIIELGFMRNDRSILLNQQSLIAQGISNGIRCFLRPDSYGEVNVQQ